MIIQIQNDNEKKLFKLLISIHVDLIVNHQEYLMKVK